MTDSSQQSAPPPSCWPTLVSIARHALDIAGANTAFRRASHANAESDTLNRLAAQCSYAEGVLGSFLCSKSVLNDLKGFEAPRPGGEVVRVHFLLQYRVVVYRDGNGDISEVMLADPAALLDDATNLDAGDLKPFMGKGSKS